MQTIFKNGNILTMEKESPTAEALAVNFGLVYKLGRNEDVEPLASASTKVIDLHGKTLLPGFIDAHNHFCLFALLMDQADCRPASGCVRGEDVIDSLRAKASEVPHGQWVMGWGYAPYLLEDKKDLTREDLDRASRDHPICLVHVSVHAAVVNTMALQELGFNKKTADPPGGKIHRDTQGEPNGILAESAFMGPLFFQTPSIYAKVLGGYQKEERAEMMIRCSRHHHRLGIVGIHDPFVDPLTLRTYQEAAETGRFLFRVNAYTVNHLADPLFSAGILTGFGSQWVKMGAIKIFMDGGMSSRTAAVFEPYVGGGRGTGVLNYDQDAITEEIRKFDKNGYQISIHAQGDRALETLLKAFEETIEKDNPLRHHIVHAGNLTKPQLDKVRELGLYIVSQANFFSLLGDGFIEAYGPDRSQTLYPFNTLLDQGIPFALSSDSPVADPNPLLGIRDSVLRKTARGRDLGPAESITVDQALPLYTRESAYFSFEEGTRGTIKEGKLADFVVLGENPLEVPPEDLVNCPVEMTVVGGKIVHENG